MIYIFNFSQIAIMCNPQLKLPTSYYLASELVNLKVGFSYDLRKTYVHVYGSFNKWFELLKFK